MTAADEPETSSDRLQEIARAAVARSSARRAEAANRLEQARLEHEQRFAAAAAALQSSVTPLLEQAKAAFESEGVPVNIIANFDSASAAQAQIAIECCGPFWSDSHGAVALAASNRAVFLHDGTDFYVGIAKSYSKQVFSQTRVDGEIAGHVLRAVEEVVESFFRDVERRCRS